MQADQARRFPAFGRTDYLCNFGEAHIALIPAAGFEPDEVLVLCRLRHANGFVIVTGFLGYGLDAPTAPALIENAKMGCRAAAEFLHDIGDGLTIIADFNTAERAVADFEDFGLIAFRAIFAPRQCGENEELWRRAVAFPILWLTHQVAVIVKTGRADDHDAGQGICFAKGLPAGFDKRTVFDQSAQELA